MTTATRTNQHQHGFVVSALTALSERLSEHFSIRPNRLEGETEESLLERAQKNYELAKECEINAAIELDYIKFTATSEKEAAITRIIERDKENAPLELGWKAISRSAAEKLVDLDPDYTKYRRRTQDAVDDKRLAEKYHSIAYQRLETLREVFRKS